MTCQDVRDRLSVWRDGEAAGSAGLSSDERAAIGSHLDECVSCQEVLAGLDRSVSSVRELPSPASPLAVTMRALALGRQHADVMPAATQIVAATLPAVESAVRYTSAAGAAAPAPTEFLSSKKRPSRFRATLFIGLGLLALILLALALGFRF